MAVFECSLLLWRHVTVDFRYRNLGIINNFFSFFVSEKYQLRHLLKRFQEWKWCSFRIDYFIFSFKNLENGQIWKISLLNKVKGNLFVWELFFINFSNFPWHNQPSGRCIVTLWIKKESLKIFLFLFFRFLKYELPWKAMQCNTMRSEIMKWKKNKDKSFWLKIDSCLGY